jgi:hypothetical protein
MREGDAQPLTPARVALVAVCLVAAWLALSGAAYFAWVQGTDHLDFFPRWAGARLTLFDGYTLYDPATTTAMQVLLYGAPLPPEVDQQAFAYPAQIIVQLAPFWLIDDVRIATALWQGTSVLLFFGAIYALLSVFKDVPRWLIIPGFVWQYTLLMLFQGQFTILPLAALAVGYALYQHQHDLWAGVVLSLGLVKPELMLIPAACLALHALVMRRWRLVIGLIGCGLLLLMLTIALFGWWIPRWLEEIRAYQGFAQSAYALQTAWEVHPALFILILLLMGAGVRSLFHSPRTLLAGSICLGMLLLPQTLLWGLTLLVIPLLASWHGWARWGITLVWLTGWATLFIVQRTDTTWRLETLILCVLALGVSVWAWQLPDVPIKSQGHEAMKQQVAP